MPVYPPSAFANRTGGDVILIVEYSTDGRVEGVRPVVGDPVLVKAAVDAVEQWSFYPLKEKGLKFRGVTYVGFQFVATADTVFSSFPFGKWEEVAATPSSGDQSLKSKRVRISSGVAASNKISGDNPRYPEGSRYNRIQGAVDLRTIIDEQGEIKLLQVVEAPAPDLALSAVEAVKTWKYRPYALNGQALEVETVVRVNYTLQ
jgi:TonB family protein